VASIIKGVAMNKYLKESEKLPGEQIVSVIPYRPFSILIVTSHRIIGKRLLGIGPSRFEGEIPYNKIVNVKYLPGTPLIKVPSITVEYKKNDEKIERVTIRFPGFSLRLAGYSPESVYSQIVERTKDESD